MASVQQVLLGLGASSTAGYLDGLATSPRAVYSIRKQISTATNAIRVRRSSDNAEQDIGFTGTALDTTSLASFVSSNSAFVTKIYDQTGNGQDAVQATAANQPRIVNAGVYDGKIVFDGSNDFLKVTSLTNAGTTAWFYAKMKQSPGATKVIFETSTNYNTNAGAMTLYADITTNYGVGMCQSSGNTRAVNFALGLTTMKQVTCQYDRTIVGSTEVAAWVGGGSVSPGSAAGTTECTGNFTTYDVYIASRAGTSAFADMELDTMVFYNVDTASIRTSIEALVA